MVFVSHYTGAASLELYLPKLFGVLLHCWELSTSSLIHGERLLPSLFHSSWLQLWKHWDCSLAESMSPTRKAHHHNHWVLWMVMKTKRERNKSSMTNSLHHLKIFFIISFNKPSKYRASKIIKFTKLIFQYLEYNRNFFIHSINY